MWVTYPKGSAGGKHDLLLEQWPLPHSLNDLENENSHLYFSSMDEMRQSLETKASHHGKQLITTIYSYSDSPSPDTNGEPLLTHPLIIIGFVSNEIVSDLLTESFQECTIAVKLSYGEHKKRLKRSDIVKSENFLALMKKLKKAKYSAVVACDKYKRVLFLRPFGIHSSSDEAPATTSQRDNYAGVCYYGKFKSIHDMIQKQNEWIPSSPPYPPPDDDEKWVATSPPYPPDDEYMNASPPWRPNNSSDENDGGPLWNPETPPMDEGLQFKPETPPLEEEDGNGLWEPGMPNSDVAGNVDGSGNGDGANEEVPLWEVPDNMPTSSFSDAVPSLNDNDETNNEENFHKNKGAAAADEFYSGLTRNLDTRADSRLFHMRAFNGWVKATQIAELNPRIIENKIKPTKKRARISANTTCRLNILDLACGKGGDLNKWILQKRGMDNYVGVDVARGSLVDAAKRAKELGSSRRLSKARFVCADLGADVPSRKKDKLLTWIMDLEKEGTWMDPKFEFLPGGGISKNDRFHVVSIQFAIHYMMQTRERARRFFKTVSDLLEIGGNLIATTVDTRVVLNHLMGMGLNLQEKPKENVTVVVGGGVCRFKFEPEIIEKIFIKKEKYGLEYTFTLVEGDDHGAGVGEAVDLPEWLIPMPVLEELAEEAGLELEEYENFHDFYRKRKDPGLFPSAHNALYNMKVLDRTGSISKEEWSVSRVYVAVKFTKVRESNIVLVDDNDDEEEEEEEEKESIVPVVKASTGESLKKSKMYPMAMMKAKKVVGEKWNSLTAEEKTRLTKLELEKM